MSLDTELEALRRENAQLRDALEARKLVERAKGLLMEWKGLSEREAYRRLQKASMDTRRSMADVALAVLLTGECPQPDRGRRAPARREQI